MHATHALGVKLKSVAAVRFLLCWWDSPLLQFVLHKAKQSGTDCDWNKSVLNGTWLNRFEKWFVPGEKAHVVCFMTVYNWTKCAVWTAINPEFLPLSKSVNLRSLSPTPRPLQPIMDHSNLVDTIIPYPIKLNFNIILSSNLRLFL
jgi:hypothetical protein